MKLPQQRGGAGLLVPISIATDATTSQYFGFLIKNSRLGSLTGFYEVRQWFPGTDDRKGFAALTLAPASETPPSFAFEIKNTSDLFDDRRRFTLSSDEIE